MYSKQSSKITLVFIFFTLIALSKTANVWLNKLAHPNTLAVPIFGLSSNSKPKQQYRGVIKHLHIDRIGNIKKVRILIWAEDMQLPPPNQTCFNTKAGLRRKADKELQQRATTGASRSIIRPTFEDLSFKGRSFSDLTFKGFSSTGSSFKGSSFEAPLLHYSVAPLAIPRHMNTQTQRTPSRSFEF